LGYEFEPFSTRHIGPVATDVERMLYTVGADSLEQLIDQTIPPAIRLKEWYKAESLTEREYLEKINELASKNRTFKSYIGEGYYGTITPPVIQRHIFENPGWYTQYTPYQAEIAQGRLEALLNFQTLVCDLTGMSVANASLLDEATAAAEAMTLLYHLRNKNPKNPLAETFLVDSHCFAQNIAVIQTRAWPLGIKVEVADPAQFQLTAEVFGALLAYPGADGEVRDHRPLIAAMQEKNIGVAICSDLLALVLLEEPARWGVDIVVGSAQRMGVQMGYGGPHAAFMAVREELARIMPGRIIGVSKDRRGRSAYRMALQTREQHIRREKATSNICTAQALLAIMAGMYAVYHGPEGMRRIATRVHYLTCALAQTLEARGYTLANRFFFDTITVIVGADVTASEAIKSAAEAAEINLAYPYPGRVRISLDQTTRWKDILALLSLFSGPQHLLSTSVLPAVHSHIPPRLGPLLRTTPILTHSVFNLHHSETEMMRYIKKLENRDLSLTHSMIPLGSCTMKLNAVSELLPVSWPAFGAIHPFAPAQQTAGYYHILGELKAHLCAITGLAACSLQPNSGAQGEYAGLLVIKKYHEHHGQHQRRIMLIPSSAHGTNPASAVMAGMVVVVVACDAYGNVDLADLEQKAIAHSPDLAGCMITYPSTHGVFEESVRKLCDLIHHQGGLVYMDGANMNAQVGYTHPGHIGADVCHLNLHKTFAIPHGGGGPGMGPICVTEALAPYLPHPHPLSKDMDPRPIGSISAATYGSASILLISYAYIKMLGSAGMQRATAMAILNANYLKSRLEPHYSVLYSGHQNRCAHEFILDFRPFKNSAGIEVEDVAKRLMDYGFHAPTVSFPVAGTLMIEPTESEPLEELDRFCEALLSIRKEISDIEEGRYPRENNLLKNAPHTLADSLDENWPFPYSRSQAFRPLPYVAENKFWPFVNRINNALGDRNLICTCPPSVDYENQS